MNSVRVTGLSAGVADIIRPYHATLHLVRCLDAVDAGTENPRNGDTFLALPEALAFSEVLAIILSLNNVQLKAC